MSWVLIGCAGVVDEAGDDLIGCVMAAGEGVGVERDSLFGNGGASIGTAVLS
jgi:hypothetical protein